MKIEKVEIFGLFGRKESFSTNFNNDINIITGRNGCGKTTIIKALWYIISGNILNLLMEIIFEKITITTTEYECTIHKLTNRTCKVELTINGEKQIYEDIKDEDGDIVGNAEDRPNAHLRNTGSSVFLPTFRRIEGGFSMGMASMPISRMRSRGEIEESLRSLSEQLTNKLHTFVSSISTVDIVNLLVGQHSDLSGKNDKIQQKISQDIIKKIKAFKADKDDVKQIDAANSLLDGVRIEIEEMEKSREQIMLPVNIINELVSKLFKYSGIKLNKTLSFGDSANALNSDSLSAGEKQMLSFICYNAFYKDSIIIIDEPELSLHVDWQRQLFPILQKQQSSNQFIIATHSPFIYSKYQDKEIIINPDRGDIEA